MALAESIFILIAVGVFAIISGALGHRLLRFLRFELASNAEHLLCSVALGVICFEVLIFVTEVMNQIRIGIITLLVLALLLGIGDFGPVLRKVRVVWQKALGGSHGDKVLIAMTIMVLLVEGLASVAPLSGSDALHYHFTAPLLVLRSGFHPNFFLMHSFFRGQSHLLILTGLALGSARLANGLVFLGGVLAAAACVCLAQALSSKRWAWIAALSFLLTPLVFWQISTSGAPDVWMAFFTTLGVIVISRCNNAPPLPHAMLAGALAGAVAGTKYTGCIFAAGLILAYVLETRSISKAAVFAMSALGAGVWPYARNLAWTGDPLFPFLLRWISPGKVNAYALSAYLADTGAGVHRSVSHLLRVLLFAEIDPSHLGFWHYLGPFVLTFAPLLFLVAHNTSLWRSVLTVWILSALGIGFSSTGSRFLLPALPIALAAVLAGVEQLKNAGWRIARVLSLVVVSCTLLFGGGGLLIYDLPALLVAAGVTSQQTYLRRQVPEYAKAEFINSVLSEKAQEGNALVFMRHLFYLRVPFLYGDPTGCWAIDPSKMRTAEDWQALFGAQRIRWIIRSPDYPPAIAPVLKLLEARGGLSPVASTEVSDFTGMRLNGQRQTVAVTIFRVNE